MLRMRARGKAQELLAQLVNAPPFRRRDGKQGRAGKAELRQRRIDFRLYLLDPSCFYAVSFGQRAVIVGCPVSWRIARCSRVCAITPSSQATTSSA